MKKEITVLQKLRARNELKKEVLKTIHYFKSKEEPKVKLTKRDKEAVLAEIIHGWLL